MIGRRLSKPIACALGALLACAGFADAATQNATAPSIAEASNFSIKAARVEKQDAPKIDGDLSDAAWSRAQVIDEFRQIDPDPGELETEKTELRIVYDADTLYIAIYCHDREPDKIIMRAMARDGELFTGDFVRVFLDPGKTRRNGYLFEVGASGGRRDAILQNNETNLVNWNTTWDAKVRLVADGYTVEMAIPFRSISYDPNAPDWGFDFSRLIRRKNERTRWTSYTPAIRLMDISQSGTLTGISDINQGIGLDVQVYGRLTYKHDWKGDDHGALSGTGSANAYYKITPALTGTLTVNPDFSDSPLDPRQVNTTRFSLFTPETREFFLQDIANFEFGGFGFVDSNNARPFFSRNIGLVNGRPVTILGGGKLSGSYDGIGIGALSVLTNKTRNTDRQVLSVARLTAPVLARSKLGVIVTNGDPSGATDNTLAGTDFQYLNTSFMGDNIVQGDFFYERSFSSDLGEDDSFGAALTFPNEPIGGQLRFKQVGQNFDPALGFVNRSGVRIYDGYLNWARRFRGKFFREISPRTEQTFVTLLDNHLESRESAFGVQTEIYTSDQFDFYARNYFEDVPVAFNLPKGVPVPAGRYDWTNAHFHLDSSLARPVRVNLDAYCCSFYNGSAVELNVTVAIRFSEYFELSPSWHPTWIELPTGSVDIHVLALETILNFSPDMQLLTQAQFDNISRNFGFSARYRWEFRRGSEFFVAFAQSALIPGTNFRPQTSQLSLRLGHLIRF